MTIDDVLALADADSLSDPPLTQDQADYLAAVLAAHPDAHYHRMSAAGHAARYGTPA